MFNSNLKVYSDDNNFISNGRWFQTSKLLKKNENLLEQWGGVSEKGMVDLVDDNGLYDKEVTRPVI